MNLDWTRLLGRSEIHFDVETLKRLMRGRSVLVTGAGGSVGGALADLLPSLGTERIVFLDSHEASLVRLRQRWLSANGSLQAHFVLADVRNDRKISRVFREFTIDTVFHLAAYKQVPLAEDNVDQIIDVNIGGALTVAEVAIAYDAETFVYPSTDKAVNPPSVYGATKRVVERFLVSFARQANRPAFRLVRLVNVFGSQGSLVEVLAHQLASGDPLTITDPAMDRYWITMSEATQLLVAAASRPTFEGIYILDTGEPMRLLETARRVTQLLRPGEEPEIRIIGARPGERLHEELAYSFESRYPTDLDGLVVLAQPKSVATPDAWVKELHSLLGQSDDTETGELRDRLFQLASIRNEQIGQPHAASPLRTIEDSPGLHAER